MRCPQCGYSPPRGRPATLNVATMQKQRANGLSYRVIAAKLGCTEGAVRAALKRQQ